jgi:uncharacterized protein (TIGR02117 family)
MHVPTVISSLFEGQGMRKIARAFWYALLAVATVVIFILFLYVATVRYADPALFPARAGDAGVTVAIADHGVHAGIVLDRQSLADAAITMGNPQLLELTSRFEAYPFLEIGWGDEQFYRFAPALSDVTVVMAGKALLGLNAYSVLHVVGLEKDAVATFPHSDVQTIRLSHAGFARLVDRLEKTFAQTGNGQLVELGQGIYGPSLFYRAVGHYSLLSTCNRWVSDLLNLAGLASSPVPSALSSGLLAELRLRNSL